METEARSGLIVETKRKPLSRLGGEIDPYELVGYPGFNQRTTRTIIQRWDRVLGFCGLRGKPERNMRRILRRTELVNGRNNNLSPLSSPSPITEEVHYPLYARRGPNCTNSDWFTTGIAAKVFNH